MMVNDMNLLPQEEKYYSTLVLDLNFPHSGAGRKQPTSHYTAPPVIENLIAEK